MSVKYILIYDDAELEKTSIERFPSLEKLTTFVQGEKLLPEQIEAYEVKREVRFKIVTTFEAKQTEMRE